MIKIWKSSQQINMSVLEHLEELRARLLWIIIVFSLITFICILQIKNITYFLQEPATGIKFLQLAPGEYFFASMKISIFFGLILSSPFSLYQIILFILPGLTLQEIKRIIPLLISSIILFFFGLVFSFKILVPTALSFFIKYGSDVVEPIWSFEQYFNFVLILVFTSALTFQIPIIQIIGGLLNIYSSKQMLSFWRPIIFISTIVSAVVTPSTDPITQMLMTFIILMLYFSGIVALKIMHK